MAHFRSGNYGPLNTTEISKGRHTQIAMAFSAGRQAAIQYLAQNPDFSAWMARFAVDNPYSDRGCMPAQCATVQGALWQAYNGGIERAIGEIINASTCLRNARFFMLRATELGRA